MLANQNTKPLKIVIVSKNCFPALGPRAHRTTELAIALANKEHQVIVYALSGEYDYNTFTQKTGVIIKNLGTSKLGVTDNVGYYNKSFWAKAIRKIFAKPMEVPNIELIPMVKKALKKEGKIDYLITIAHPHTIHWGAAAYLKRHKNVVDCWVADCGDPYMKNPYHSHPSYFAGFEKKWGKLCDYITVPVASAKNAYYKAVQPKIRVVPQGFQFDDIKLADYHANTIPTFAFSGMVYAGQRDPSAFLNYLKKINIDFKFIVYTKKKNFFNAYQKQLGNKLEVREYVPREQLLSELSQMDFLINIKNISQVQQPSKLIDYALTGRPILEITSNFEEQQAFTEFLNGDYKQQLELKQLERYNIRNVANQFLGLYEEKR